MADLKTTDAKKLLSEYRFHRESSLRSQQQGRQNQALSCFIIAFAALQLAYQPTGHKNIFLAGAILLSICGFILTAVSFIPARQAKKLAEKNDKTAEELEARLD